MRLRWIMTLGAILTLFGHSATLERNGWNLIAVCQDINRSDVNMSNISEIQRQDGATIYGREWSEYSNLDTLEAGYAYWVKGESGIQFESGEAQGLLVKPLKRNGWSLIGACEDIAQSDIDMSQFEEIQNQNGNTLYTGVNAGVSNLDGLVNGYGYWVKGSLGTPFISKKESIVKELPIRTEPLSTYLQKMKFGTEGDNFWKSSTTEQQALVGNIVTDILNRQYIEAHTKAKTLNGELLKVVDGDSAYYVLHLDLERFSDENYHALGGTYVFNPKGTNSAIQVPHPVFDTNTDKEGIETYVALNSRYLLISGTHRKSSLTDSSCQSSYKESDASHNTAHSFFHVHKAISTLDNKALFIELHGFGNTTRETIWSQCDGGQNTKIINISEGIDDLNSSSFMHLFHEEITNNSTIKSCIYSPANNSGADDIYTSSLGGTMNTTARFTNGSSNVCSSAASNSSHRFIHVEQSYEVRSEERETIINALKIALVKYNQVEIAHRYGKATQPPKNGYYYYDAPENAIDGNLSTWNHTQCTETENWWQLELPKLSKVAKVVVYNRSGQTARLNGTKLYLGTQEYNGTLIESNDIETLTGSGEAQSFNYSPMKEGNYLLLKGDGTNCLHVAEVEVYGVLSDRPEFKTHESNYLIQGTTANGTEVATIEALDYQGDSLIYSIVGDVPFTIDNNGNITVNGTLGGKEYHFDVLVSDGVNSASTPITIQATTANAVEEALVSGSVLNVTEEELIQAARDEISSLKVGNSLLSQLYQNGSISYTSGNYHSQLINMYGDGSKTFPILYGNKNNVLAIAGQKEAGRFSVFASNPLYFFDRDENLEYESYMKRVFVWLIGEEPIDMNLTNTDKTVALSFVSDSSAVERWITKNYPNWSLKSCNDKATLESCYGDADLILLGRSGTDADAEAMRSVLPKMLTAAKSILYVHDNWGQNSLSQVVADLFEFSFPYGGNYWANDAALWTNIEEMQLALFNSFGYASIDTMLTHFQDGDYNFDWNQCTDGNGAFGSQYDKCADVAGLNSEFQKGATKVREMMNGLDGSKKNIFLSTGYRLQKLLVLIGDRFRQSVAYPMDKATTDDNEFMKAYYSDHAVYNYRFINPVQKDMGNFSRSDFSHITPYSKTVNLTSKKNFRSTGVYALPGQTMRVTRNDNSAVTTKVFINSLRSGATHEFESNGYKRPKFLQTPSFTIGSGESIELTSPYGGPVHIAFNINDLDVSFTFENIGEHAYWASPADDDSFTQKLDAGNFDWAEVVTSAFEVHSTLDKMRESVADAKWGTAEALAAATQRYMSNFPHVLAGFKGPGIDVVEEIHDFAATNSLTIENLDLVKHMNADQATCGYGCSGNPYDAYWAFSPIGHGDVHELGHGLEKSRFKFEGFELHAITNPYSYYTKSKYNETTGGEPDCQNLPFKEVFEKLQSSVAESNSTEYLKTNLWESSNWSHQVLVTIQAMMHTQKMGKLDNGWHLLARLHILEREITQAKVDWEANKASLGFDSYTLDEFNAMRNNDWLLVSFSFASGLDFRDYLSMMGIEYSQKASDQVASFNYTAVPKAFFVSTPNGYCKSDDTYGAFLSKSTLDVDGTTGFPY